MERKQYKRSCVSKQAPGFFKIKGVPLSDHREGNLCIYSQKGKPQVPDRRNGLCKDFPLNLNSTMFLFNSTSRQNNLWDPPLKQVPLSGRIPDRRGAFIPLSQDKQFETVLKGALQKSKKGKKSNNFQLRETTETPRRYSTPSRYLNKTVQNFTSSKRNIFQREESPTLKTLAEDDSKEEIRLPNPERVIDEDYRKKESKSLFGFRKDSLQNLPAAGDTQNYFNSTNKRSASVAQALKTMSNKIRKNCDPSALLNATCSFRTDKKVLRPSDLSLTFQQYQLSEGQKQDKSNIFQLQARKVESYDPILNQKTMIQPPAIEVQGYDRYKQNVAKLLTKPKAFNKVLGPCQFEIQERVKDGNLRTTLRQSYTEEQQMQELLKEVEKIRNQSLKRSKKSSALLRTGKNSLRSNQIVEKCQRSISHQDQPRVLNIDSLAAPEFVGRVLSTEHSPPSSPQKTRNNSYAKSNFSKTNYFTFGRHSKENRGRKKSPELSFQIPTQTSFNLSDTQIRNGSKFFNHSAKNSDFIPFKSPQGSNFLDSKKAIMSNSTFYTSKYERLTEEDQEKIKMQFIEKNFIKSSDGLKSMKSLLRKDSSKMPQNQNKQDKIKLSMNFYMTNSPFVTFTIDNQEMPDHVSTLQTSLYNALEERRSPTNYIKANKSGSNHQVY